MKVDAKNIRFVAVGPWFRRRSLQFVGRANTMQLLETALVIEGYRQTIGYPVIDFLFRWALSEWTTVTVPYSRIVYCRFSGPWFMRGLVCLLVLLPVFGLLISLLIAIFVLGKDSGAISVFIFAAVAFPLLVWLTFRLLPARYSLKFGLPGGKVGLTRFRIKNRKLRKAFEEKLRENRKAALVA